MIHNIYKEMMKVEVLNDLHHKTQINGRTLFKINQFISDVPNDTITGGILFEIECLLTDALR